MNKNNLSYLLILTPFCLQAVTTNYHREDHRHRRQHRHHMRHHMNPTSSSGRHDIAL